MTKRTYFLFLVITIFCFTQNISSFASSKEYENEKFSEKFCVLSERKIPVAYSVDVVVVGGSTAAVSAAVSAAQSGAKVFLIAQETYLGEDVCGTYRYWDVPSTVKKTVLGAKLFGGGLPVPLKFKQCLDNELINNKVGFLFSSYVTDLLTDELGNPSGVVIANRSGRQAIKAKVVIDATPRAMVAHLTTATFTKYPKKQNFKFIVIGNNPKTLRNGKFRILSQPVVFKDKSYKAIEYSLDIFMKDDSFRSFANAEHIARDLTWDPNQVEVGDLLFQTPPDHIVGESSSIKEELDSEMLDLSAFQPKKVNRFFLLNGMADVHRTFATKLLQPGGLIEIGERIGIKAAKIAKATANSDVLKVKGIMTSTFMKGDVSELLDGIRAEENQEKIIQETTTLPILGKYDVVVMGGGTAGAPAAIGAARHGAKTILLEYLHGLGGIGTMGLIDVYFHGYQKGFTHELDLGVEAIGRGSDRDKKQYNNKHEWVTDWKTEYLRRSTREAGADVWFGVLGCGAYVENGVVIGVVVATPFGRGILLAKTVIDATGSSDIAIAAGAKYITTNANTVAVQGAGLPYKNPDCSMINTDWTFTEDTDMLDIWWTFIVSKDKYSNQYDIGKLPQTRERRRIIGDITISAMDIYNHRTYPDAISYHISSFDTHGFTEDPYFFLKPPKEEYHEIKAFVPFRALLPKGIEGIIVTGLSASANRDAMPVIRMQACLQNQGYAVGWAAALAAKNKQFIRNINLKPLQQELVKMGNLPPSVITDEDNYPPKPNRIKNAIALVAHELDSLELLLWDKKQSIPYIEQALANEKNSENKLIYARILGTLGNSSGWEILQKLVENISDWDAGWNYKGLGQFGKSSSAVDGLIIALGRTKKDEAIPALQRMAEKLTSKSEFSHFRAMAIALESIGDRQGASVIYNLLQLQGIMGHSMTSLEIAKKQMIDAGNDENTTRNNSLRELLLARALFRCGDINGLGKQILLKYTNDLRAHYYLYAKGILKI